MSLSPWPTMKLEEAEEQGLIELGRGKVISRHDIAADPGEYPVYSSSAQGDGEFGRMGGFMFDEELVTWSIDGGGKLFYRPKSRFSVTNVCGWMRSLSPKVDLRFLHASLEHQRQKISFDYQLKAHPSVIRKLYDVSLPPLPEQRRIAEILSSVDEAIQATEAVIEQTRNVKDGVLERLLTKGIGHTEFKETEIGPIPRGWEVRSLGEIADFVNGRGFKPHEWGMKGLPIIRIQNLNGSDVFNYYEGEFAQKLVVSPGDLLFAWSGSRGTSFGPHIWKGPMGLLNYHTWRVHLFEPDDRDFIYFALRRLTRTIEADSHGASALVHMQKKAVVEYQIPFPPAWERTRIAEILRGHDAVVGDIEGELASLRSTKAALMSELLTGRKRVTDLLAQAVE